MSLAWNSVSLLVVVLLSSSESETSNITAFTSSPLNPSYAEEGNNLTLKWTYTLDGTVGLAQFSIDNDGTDLLIGKKFSPGVIPVEPKYRLRFRAQVSDIRAELNILAVRRSDEATYKLNVSPTGSGTLGQVVVVIVKFPPSITEISGNQTVNERENATLQCLTDGNPTPNTTWTRDSDNSVVNMPLTDIRRGDAGKYRCTADNGIKGPATGDVWVVVQYPVEVTGFGKNVTVPQGGEQTFSCPVDGIPKPNISWYRDGEVGELPIFTGEKLEVRESGCYTCVASNSLGKPVIMTQCLIVEEEESSMSSTSPTSTPKGPNRTIIGVVVGVAVFVIIVSGLMIWWVCKKKECLRHSKNEELDYVAVDQTNNGESLGIEAPSDSTKPNPNEETMNTALMK